MLVAGAQAGDREATDALLRRHVERIHMVCRRLMGHEADAADAAQEALIAIVRGLPRFDGRAAFTTWAYRVATNACLDELRRRKRRPDAVEDEVLAAHAHGSATDTGDPAVRVDIDAALRKLPLEFRAPVVLRDLCGLDYAEIGDVLQLPAGTVKSRIARARAALADLLGGNPVAPTDRQSS